MASIERFFKIFPMLGMHAYGLDNFSKYLCSKVSYVFLNPGKVKSQRRLQRRTVWLIKAKKFYKSSLSDFILFSVVKEEQRKFDSENIMLHSEIIVHSFPIKQLYVDHADLHVTCAGFNINVETAKVCVVILDGFEFSIPTSCERRLLSTIKIFYSIIINY